MVEGRLYRTRLCPHYLIGNCSRNNFCNFAHGSAQLRRPHPPKRQDQNWGTDLRQMLARKRSPSKTRLTYGVDARRSVRTGIGRHHSKRQQLDSQGNYSGRLRVPDKTEDQVKAKKLVSPDSKVCLDEKLTQMNSEIKKLETKKRKLEIYLGDKVQEAEVLKLKIHDLEMHLSVEKEECKGITARIKKFIQAHKLRQHLQEELKSSNAQLRKLGEQLDMHATEPGYERVPKIIDEVGGKFSSPSTECPEQKRTRTFLEVHGVSNQVSPVSKDIGKLKLDKLSRQSEYHDQPRYNKESDIDGHSNDEHRSCSPEEKPGRETSPPLDATSADKYKVSGVSVTLSGIMDNVMDANVVGVNEMEETLPEVGVASKDHDMQFLPPPPPFIPQNIHPEYVSEAAVTPSAITAHVMDENVVEFNGMEESLPEERGSSKDQDLQFLPPPPPFISRAIHPESKVSEALGTPAGVTAHVMGVASKDQNLPFLPPPPPFIPQNIHNKYKGNDADADVSEPEEGEVISDVD